MEKKKIAEIITRLEVGGTYDMLSELLAYLPKEKYEITLIIGNSPQLKNEIEDFSEQNDIKLIWINSLIREINPIKDIKAYFEIKNILRKYKFDIVHTHTSKGGFLGRIAAKAVRTPYVIHSTHGHVFFGYFGKLKSRLIILLEKISAKYADKIIVLSNNEAKEHLKLGIGKEHQFIPVYNGIDFTKFPQKIGKNEKRDSFGIKQDEKVITMIARLEPVKGHKYFIEALGSIKKEDPSIKIKALFIGNGSLSDELKLMARDRGIEEITLFLSYRKDIDEILGITDLLVLPSLNEGFGIVLAEALYMEVPVIATRVGGIPEVVEHEKTGILVEPANSPDLSKAIIRMLRNYDYAKELAKNGKKIVEKRFSIIKMCEKTQGIYEKI